MGGGVAGGSSRRLRSKMAQPSSLALLGEEGVAQIGVRASNEL